MDITAIFRDGKVKNSASLTINEIESFTAVTNAVYEESKLKKVYYYDSKAVFELESAQIILHSSEKISYLFYLLEVLIEKGRMRSINNVGVSDFDLILFVIYEGVTRSTLPLSEEQLYALLELHLKYEPFRWSYFDLDWDNIIRQTERFFKTSGILLSKRFTDILDACKETVKRRYENTNQFTEKNKYINRIDTVFYLYTGKVAPSFNQSIYFSNKDELGVLFNRHINQMPDKERNDWFLIMACIQNVSGSKPTAKFFKETEKLIQNIDKQWIKDCLLLFLALFIQQENKDVSTGYWYHGIVTELNKEYIKGLIWLCTSFKDKHIWLTLTKVCERAYRKTPGIGPEAPAIGNACLYVLAQHTESISYLSRLKMRIRQPNTKTLIEKYLTEAAQKLGISTSELEDIVNNDFELTNGQLIRFFDDYKAILKIEQIGKTSLNWYKPDGTPQKTEPGFVKEKYREQLIELKNTAKQIQTNLTVQRDRLDSELKLNRIHRYTHFKTCFLEHGLMSFITKKLIWEFSENTHSFTGIWLNGGFVDLDEQPIEVKDQQSVKLWHPALHSPEEVRKWRDFLNKHQIIQPVKQAYREIYLLTDAEINTRMYSNRMAAHILKQYQFNSLAKLRGWAYSPLNAHDGGNDFTFAKLHLPQYHLKAEYWVSNVNANDAWSDAGIWLYITTDQVRFLSTENGRLDETVPLTEVPRLVFSEIMRDVDLFVGVAGVGNDPNWRDSGGIANHYRNYWQSYSFGEIGEIGKIRHEIIAGLLPKLKIAPVAELQERFLVIKGRLRTYKIHLQSTNILMSPNDQYLCIVPDRSKPMSFENVFLPFEGDSGLSIILSKAFLLANDDKITDTTIIRQINQQ